MHDILFNLDVTVQASIMKTQCKRKREATEATDEFDDARWYVVCLFCQKQCADISGLKTHLSKWRNEAPGKEDKHHKVDPVRQYADSQH